MTLRELAAKALEYLEQHPEAEGRPVYAFGDYEEWERVDGFEPSETWTHPLGQGWPNTPVVGITTKKCSEWPTPGMKRRPVPQGLDI